MDMNNQVPSPEDEEEELQGQFEEIEIEPVVNNQPEEMPFSEAQAEESPSVETTEEGPAEPEMISEIEEKPASFAEEPDKAPKEESKLEKGFRRTVQWVIVGLLLLGIGGVLVFFLMVRPAREELLLTSTELQSTQEKLSQTENDLTVVRGELKNTRDELQSTQNTLQGSIDKVQYLRVLSDINTARYALVKKEGSTVLVALKDAQTQLKTILKPIDAKDKQLATLLEERLQRAINKLGVDPVTAETDLNILIQDLKEMEDLLFP